MLAWNSILCPGWSRIHNPPASTCGTCPVQDTLKPLKGIHLKGLRSERKILRTTSVALVLEYSKIICPSLKYLKFLNIKRYPPWNQLICNWWRDHEVYLFSWVKLKSRLMRYISNSLFKVLFSDTNSLNCPGWPYNPPVSASRIDEISGTDRSTLKYWQCYFFWARTMA